MKQNSYKWFTNKDCKYYPCHKREDINCLFCFCPLYTCQNCGGDYTLLKSGVKDCSKCDIPHTESGYDHIIAKLKIEANKRKDEKKNGDSIPTGGSGS